MKMNSSDDFGWATLVKSVAPDGCTLAAGLLTTYDRAEARLLAETLLPEWLKLSHLPGDDATEQTSFALELDDRLKQLHNRIVVVSSNLREQASEETIAADEGLYPWIWRSIRQLTVGKTGQAVQHAKLWLLHWVHPEGGQYLEIVVSSANLTRAAFRQQIQAAWRVCLPLAPKSTKVRLSAWGVLPDFMRALAVSCGDDTHLERFIDLLARTDRPTGVSFVASVPGKHASRASWGAAGLRSIAPLGRGAVSASILSPFVGAWSADSLRQWCAHFESKPERLSLAWINQDHPWVPYWLLPEATLKHLVAAGSTLLQLQLEHGNDKLTNQFHSEHRSADARWSHAKVYAFQLGNSRRLLLTSANFSQAAWGKQASNGDLTIDNFELGVCIEQANWPLGELQKFANLQEAATSAVKLGRGSCLISWAEASWDGKLIQVEYKSQSPVTGEVLSRKDLLQITYWQSGNGALSTATIRWTDTKDLPQSVALHCEAETLNVPVFDTRELAAREVSYPEEISDVDVQALCDQLLFERYGGKAVAEDETDLATDAVADDEQGAEAAASGQAGELVGDAGPKDSYAVATFLVARQMLGIVDHWVNLVAQARQGSSPFILEGLQRDGLLLMAALNRKVVHDKSIGARLAAEEFALHLNHWN
jgi:hypothetical protein